MNAMLRLPSGHPDSRLMAAIQHFGLQILRGASYTATGQVADANWRTDHCTQACGDWWCDCQRSQRGGNSRAGEVKNDGGGDARRQEKVGHE